MDPVPQGYLGVTRNFTAYAYPGAPISADEPQKVFGPLPLDQVGSPQEYFAPIGSVDVRVSFHESRYHWINDNNHTSGDTQFYGMRNITWDMDSVPLGTPVVVIHTGQTDTDGNYTYFIGNVTNCTV
jgi:hypothetical protein